MDATGAGALDAAGAVVALGESPRRDGPHPPVRATRTSAGASERMGKSYRARERGLGEIGAPKGCGKLARPACALAP